jgi:hypothetical protein
VSPTDANPTKSSSHAKSKTAMREAAYAAGPSGLQVQSVVLPNLLEWEKGAKGTDADPHRGRAAR